MLSYSTSIPTLPGQVTLISDIRDFYQSLGGEPILGPAISPPISQKGIICQYTTNVLICYNPSGRNEADRLYLAPIGLQLELQTFTDQQIGAPKVYEGFSEVYHNKFFGLRYVGQPLTGVRLNAQKGRLEQYFEKMGFYTLENDPQHTVHLLAYGTYLCQESCSPRPENNGSIFGWNKGVNVSNPASLARLGGYSLFGNPLTNPYTAGDGSQEQVLEKVVVYVPSDNPTTLRLRSLAAVLNLPYSEPAPQRFGQKENMVFYMVKGELGYHVPIVFDYFIASHGGTEISGRPLSDPYQTTTNGQKVGRQCYENYCLDYYPDAPENQNVRLASLGQLYMQVQKYEAQEIFKFERDKVELDAAKKKLQVSSQEAQTIQILLRTSQKKHPIAEIESFVILALPDGQKAAYDLPPTNASGISQVTISPISNAPNGSIIPYIVCLNVPSVEQICDDGSFLIWNVH